MPQGLDLLLKACAATLVELIEELEKLYTELLRLEGPVKHWRLRGVDLQFASHLVPYVGEGVFTCAPGVIRLDLRGQLAESSILAGGLLVHAGLGGGSGEGRLLVDEHEEATDLLVGNHPGWGLLKEAQQGNAER